MKFGVISCDGGISLPKEVELGQKKDKKVRLNL